MRSSQAVVIDPALMNGQPHLRGTQLTLSHLVQTLVRERSAAGLLARHPDLDVDQLRAAAEFAAQYAIAASSASATDATGRRRPVPNA